MPMYFYNCKDCFTEFELFVPLEELDNSIECIKPECEGYLHRQMSAPPFYI